jgi:hypothetical protein
MGATVKEKFQIALGSTPLMVIDNTSLEPLLTEPSELYSGTPYSLPLTVTLLSLFANLIPEMLLYLRFAPSVLKYFSTS